MGQQICNTFQIIEVVKNLQRVVYLQEKQQSEPSDPTGPSISMGEEAQLYPSSCDKTPSDVRLMDNGNRATVFFGTPEGAVNAGFGNRIIWKQNYQLHHC